MEATSRLLSELDCRVQVEADRRQDEFLERFFASSFSPVVVQAWEVEMLVRTTTSYHKMRERALQNAHDDGFLALIDRYGVVLQRIGMPKGCGGFHRMRAMANGERGEILAELKEVVPKLKKIYNHYRPAWNRTWTSDSWNKRYFHR